MCSWPYFQTSLVEEELRETITYRTYLNCRLFFSTRNKGAVFSLVTKDGAAGLAKKSFEDLKWDF